MTMSWLAFGRAFGRAPMCCIREAQVHGKAAISAVDHCLPGNW